MAHNVQKQRHSRVHVNKKKCSNNAFCSYFNDNFSGTLAILLLSADTGKLTDVDLIWMVGIKVVYVEISISITNLLPNGLQLLIYQ